MQSPIEYNFRYLYLKMGYMLYDPKNIKRYKGFKVYEVTFLKILSNSKI